MQNWELIAKTYVVQYAYIIRLCVFVLNHGAQLNNFYWNISVAAEIRQKKDKNCNNFWPSGEKEWNTFNLLPYSLVEWNYCTWLKQDIWKTNHSISFVSKIWKKRICLQFYRVQFFMVTSTFSNVNGDNFPRQ
jgi:hypothetical protein